MKGGILYREDTRQELARIRKALLGAEKKICDPDGNVALEADIRVLDKSQDVQADVRNKEYVLTDPQGEVLALARPDYAPGDAPEEAGWPLCRLPRVDRAQVAVAGKEYILTMENSQNYLLRNADGHQVLRVLHRGITGGWSLEEELNLSPALLCGLFVFCRYIEQENEFMVV